MFEKSCCNKIIWYDLSLRVNIKTEHAPFFASAIPSET